MIWSIKKSLKKFSATTLKQQNIIQRLQLKKKQNFSKFFALDYLIPAKLLPTMLLFFYHRI